MAVFTNVFLSWYKTNRNSVLVLVYGLSFATAAIASFAILLVFTYQFSEKLFIPILPTSPGTFLSTEEGSIWKIFAKTYQYNDMVSFFLKWGGTALILYHYSYKIGRAKYWFLLSLPLLYFSTLMVYHLHIYEPDEEFEQLIFYGVSALNSTFGGVLFYIAFKLTVKNFKGNELFASYLIMAGYGFMLFFSGSQSVLPNMAYPPFGFSTVSSYGLGSYLILVGLSLSAISISKDEQLKEMIKNSTMAESKFLHSIGMSESERENKLLKDIVIKAKQQKENLEKDTGIELSISEEDIKEFVRELEVNHNDKDKDKDNDNKEDEEKGNQ
jgi:5-bromo-4-chloroindolyl phosphate hydrolysis protein